MSNLSICMETTKAQKTRLPIIQGAMDSEINILIHHLEQVKEELILGYPFYHGLYKGHPIVVQKTFQGMTNAAAATMLALSHFSPSFIINQGVCGGHDPALHRGDIVLGYNIINYANFKIGLSDSANPLNGCQPIGLEIPQKGKVCIFHSDEHLLQIAENISAPPKNTRIFTGTIASADAWIDRKDLIKYMHETYRTMGEDMESASVAQLCFTFNIPFLSIRALSNSLIQDEEFDESTTHELQEYTLQVLEKAW